MSFRKWPHYPVNCPDTGADVLARFTEVKSGRKADRPELAKAVWRLERWWR